MEVPVWKTIVDLQMILKVIFKVKFKVVDPDDQ